MINEIRAQLVEAANNEDHVLVMAFTVSEDVLFAEDGRRRIAAHAAAAAGRAVDQVLGTAPQLEEVV